jgi:hypothetical protein
MAGPEDAQQAMVVEPRAELLTDLQAAVLEDVTLALAQVEAARHTAESQAERILMVVDIIVLPFAIGIMFLVQLCHMPEVVAPATFVPNMGYLLVRVCKRLEVAPAALIRRVLALFSR